MSPIKYAHMFGKDLELWERFMDRHGEYYERFEYDVHLGRGVPIDPTWAPEIRRAARILTQKRVDAVGYRKREVWLFEIKPDAGLSAIGQLLSYKALWIRDRGEPPKLYLAVVTDRLNPDEEYLFKEYDIRTYVVVPLGRALL